jgi:hypothetical protein
MHAKDLINHNKKMKCECGGSLLVLPFAKQRFYLKAIRCSIQYQGHDLPHGINEESNNQKS